MFIASGATVDNCPWARCRRFSRTQSRMKTVNAEIPTPRPTTRPIFVEVPILPPFPSGGATVVGELVGGVEDVLLGITEELVVELEIKLELELELELELDVEDDVEETTRPYCATVEPMLSHSM
jgi:hypothetical protein